MIVLYIKYSSNNKIFTNLLYTVIITNPYNNIHSIITYFMLNKLKLI